MILRSLLTIATLYFVLIVANLHRAWDSQRGKISKHQITAEYATVALCCSVLQCVVVCCSVFVDIRVHTDIRRQIWGGYD